MFNRVITILLLSAIAVQAVFGGLQDSVSICLGGGHEHEVAEIVEQCEMECSHHSNWPTPITDSEDIDNCKCTDLELSLIMLLAIPRDSDNAPTFTWLFPPTLTHIFQVNPCNPTWLAVVDYPPVERQQLVVVRTTVLLI
jgi:hypothetical protein